jgi:hypothetical protein
MDPGTILGILQAVGGVVVYLTDVAKTLKNAPDSLAKVAAETHKFQLQINRFYVIQQGFSAEQREYLDKQVSSDKCREILKQLEDLTLKMKPSNKNEDKMKTTDRFKWLWNKNVVEGLVEDLSNETERLWRLMTT